MKNITASARLTDSTFVTFTSATGADLVKMTEKITVGTTMFDSVDELAKVMDDATADTIRIVDADNDAKDNVVVKFNGFHEVITVTDPKTDGETMFVFEGSKNAARNLNRIVNR